MSQGIEFHTHEVRGDTVYFNLSVSGRDLYGGKICDYNLAKAVRHVLRGEPLDGVAGERETSKVEAR